jgi:hypothetical protein
MKIELILIVYEKEYEKLILLLNSIEIYSAKNFDSISIITQEQSSSKLKEALLDYLENRNFSFGGILNVKSQSEYIDYKFESNYSGWYVQQILKIIAAKQSVCDYSLLLDSKQFFVENYNISDMFVDGLPVTDLAKNDWPEASYMFSAFKKSYEVFGLNYLNYVDKSLGALTPYILNNKIVKECVSLLEEKYKQSFYQIFINLKLTEFFIYEAFLHANYKIDEIYKINKFNNSKILWGHNVTYLDYFLKLIESGELKIFGIHKSSHDVLNFLDKEKLKKMVKDRVPNYFIKNNFFDTM